MLFPTVIPKFLYVFENLELWQVVRLSRHLTYPSIPFAANITEVVIFPIVYIQPIHIIKVKIWAKPAFLMVLLNVILKRLVLK